MSYDFGISAIEGNLLGDARSTAEIAQIYEIRRGYHHRRRVHSKDIQLSWATFGTRNRRQNGGDIGGSRCAQYPEYERTELFRETDRGRTAAQRRVQYSV